MQKLFQIRTQKLDMYGTGGAKREDMEEESNEKDGKFTCVIEVVAYLQHLCYLLSISV